MKLSEYKITGEPLTKEEVDSLILAIKGFIYDTNIVEPFLTKEDINCLLRIDSNKVLTQEQVNAIIDNREKFMDKLKKIKIILAKDSVIYNLEFIGKYRRDLEQKNWHYYEKEDGCLVHVKKDNMLAVIDEFNKEE